jgi:hypothetical protein
VAVSLVNLKFQISTDLGFDFIFLPLLDAKISADFGKELN